MEMQTEKRIGLLEGMAEACKLLNLSDLRLTTAWKPYVRALNPLSASLEQWNEAVYYIYQRPIEFTHEARAQECLLQYEPLA